MGSEERVLLIFTGGFLFAHVEVDALLSLLLDAEQLTTQQWSQRFRGLDTDCSGCELDTSCENYLAPSS